MPIQLDPDSVPSKKRLHQKWLTVPLLFFASTLILSLVYLQYNWPGKWFSNVKPLGWNGAALTLNKGQGYSDQDKLVIKGLADQNIAVVSLSPPAFRAKDYQTITWSISGVTPNIEMEFLWRTADNRTFVRSLVWAANTLEPLEIAEDENWRGQIIDLAIIVKGTLAAPILINGISLEPVSLPGALPHMVKKWFALDPWQGTSINFVDGEAIDKNAPPVLAIAAIILLALLLNLILSIAKIIPLNVAMIGGMILLGWFMLDVRWQANLFQQLELTHQQFAGKTWEDKHLAAEDGALFDFMKKVKEKLPAENSRILYFSDEAYSRRKGAYHLYPHNVLALNDLPPASKIKTGDYIALFAKKSVQYDRSHQLLMWSDGQSIKVDLLFLAEGNALFKVR
ncbi:conserved membrane hypothetical protein [Candidatus Nitrotoga sp. HW29]|uniref:hypothetical protein n=1 Tax=Candidatus Nitrotoga sp. HW29 TaxID=2886963 RepID=UPI001EF16B36|nr:hypothetical protein [Candidatus Nitrotoga sp. HW29]CAH1904827.1 conserved membrane hypothetical protein [Candidatus Nitrotoga sp. HW29]